MTTPPSAPRGSARPVWCRTLSMGTVFLSAQSISPACWPEAASAGHNSEALAHSEGTRSHAATLPATYRRRCINCIMNCIYVYIHGSWFSECNHTGLFVYGLTGFSRLFRPLEYWNVFMALKKMLLFWKNRGLNFLFKIWFAKVLIHGIILWANIFRCRVCYSRTSVVPMRLGHMLRINT